MFTRCPDCASAYPVDAALLARAGGRVQCGQCGREFSVLTGLYDDRPRGDAMPPPTGPEPGLPVLDGEQRVAQAEIPPQSFAYQRPAAASGPRFRAWLAVLVLLALVTVAHAAYTFREPLLESPAVRSRLQAGGWLEPHRPEPFSDPKAIRVVSRDLQAHANRVGILVFSATYVNRADHPQAWPGLELTLLDSSSLPVARRVFRPDEYLGTEGNPAQLLAPGLHVPVRLEFADPGKRATGFELNFR